MSRGGRRWGWSTGKPVERRWLWSVFSLRRALRGNFLATTSFDGVWAMLGLGKGGEGFTVMVLEKLRTAGVGRKSHRKLGFRTCKIEKCYLLLRRRWAWAGHWPAAWLWGRQVATGNGEGSWTDADRSAYSPRLGLPPLSSSEFSETGNEVRLVHI